MQSLFNDQNLIYIVAVSVFLPYIFTCAIILFVTAVILLVPNNRRRIFVHDGSKWLLPFFALVLIIPLFYKNFVGIAAGAGLICVVLIGLYARSAMTVRTYEHMLDIMTKLSVPIAVAAMTERVYLKIYDPGNLDNFRCVSVFFNSNYFATVAATMVIICAYKAGTHQGMQLKYFIIAGLNMISAYLSGSLFVWVEIFVGVSLVFIMLKKHEMISGLLLGAGIFCFLIYFAPGIILPRLAESPLTTDRRLDIWDTAIRAFLDAPIFGRGTLTYYHIFENYPNGFATTHAHNLLLDPLLNYGIVGTALMSVYILCVVKRLITSIKKRPDGRITVLITAVIAAAIAHGTTDVTLLWVQTGLLFLLIIAGLDLGYRRALHPPRTLSYNIPL